MAETETLEQRVAELESQLAALTSTTPTEYYTHQYSGEEIDAAVGRAAAGGTLDSSVSNVSKQLDTHTARTDNPHGVTAAQIGATAFLGESPIKTTTDDTPANWNNIGSGFAWYGTAGQLNDQPGTWGFLVNYARGSDVFQIWRSQSGGPTYTRSGNASGWATTWVEIIDTSNIGSQSVDKAKYASGQSATGAVLRNEALYSSNTTPSSNGQINWTYG